MPNEKTKIQQSFDELKKAKALYSAGKHEKAKTLLDKFLEFNRFNALAYSLHAKCLVAVRDYGHAVVSAENALKIDEKNIDAYLVKAFVLLLNNSREGALKLYIKILTIEADNKIAKNNLDLIKKLSADDELFAAKLSPAVFIDGKGRIFRMLNRLFKVLILIVSVAALSAAAYFFIIPELRAYIDKRELEKLGIDERTLFAELKDEVQNSSMEDFDPDELNKMFLKAKKHIQNGEPNEAILIINKVALSDAMPILKMRFENLRANVEEPGLSDFENNIDYSSLMERPLLYQSVFVKWKGETDVVVHKDGKTFFKLIVRSGDEESADGIAHVMSDGKLNVKKGGRLEIYGRFSGVNEKSKSPFITLLALKHLIN